MSHRSSVDALRWNKQMRLSQVGHLSGHNFAACAALSLLAVFEAKGRNQVYTRQAASLQCASGLQLRCLCSYSCQDLLSCESVCGYPLCCVICIGYFEEAVACANIKSAKLRQATVVRRVQPRTGRQCQYSMRADQFPHRPEARTLLLMVHLGLDALALGAVN